MKAIDAMIRFARLLFMFLPVLCLAALPLSACTSATSSGTTTIDYTTLVSDSKAAYAVLKAEADALVAAGKLDAVKAAQAEQAAEAAIAAMSVTGGSVTLKPQNLAQAALTALVTLQSLLPAALLPPAVTLAMQVAETALAAFLALDPASAVAVRAQLAMLAVPARPVMVVGR